MKLISNRAPAGKRALSFLLAVLMIIVMLPVLSISATAADTPSALRVGSILSERSYNSSAIGSSVSIRDIPVTFDDGTSSFGFCYKHNASLTAYTTGYRWVTDGNAINISSTAAAPFLAHFYYNLNQGSWNAWERELVSSWVQVALWMSQTGQFNDYNNATQLRALAEERVAVLKLLGLSTVTVDESLTLFYQIISAYESGAYGNLTAYVYYFDDNSAGMQPVFVGFLERTSTDRYSVYVKLSKTLSGSSGYYAGASFGVYMDAACADKRADIKSTSSQWSTSGEIRINSETATLYVKEISSGDASVTKNSGVFSVNVSASANGTAATSAAVVGDGADGSIVNTTVTPPPSGPNIVIQKIDGASGAGLGGAVFKLEGNATSGGYVSTNVTSAADGTVTLQWSDPQGDNYIAPGEYTVTETKAPAGYEKSADARHLHLWLEDDGGSYIQRSSGTLVFENFKQHSVVFRKVSESGTGLVGAVFDVFRNGTKLGSYTTGGSGTITISDVSTGYYEFVETTPPAGYLLPATTSAGVYVDTSDSTVTEHYLTMMNYEYPEIVIQKFDSVTNLPLAGATFEVMIDAAVLGTFTTSSTGRINISYAQYKDYLTDGNEVWTVTVTEVSAPDGYFDADSATQTNQLKKGQSLSTFSFKNQPYPNVVVYKTDGGTTLPLAGAVFTLTGVDNQNSFVEVTGSDGLATFTKVPVGTYKLAESSAPEGYILNEEVKTVVVKADGSPELRYEYVNDRKPDLLIQKIDAVTGEPVSGVSFTVKKADRSTITTVTTDASGEYLLEALDPGVYEVTEVAVPDNYLISREPTQKITLVPNETGIVKFENYKKPTLTINKLDSITGDAIKGAKFHIEYASNNTFTGELNDLGFYYSDENGKITLEKQLDGWYRITEIEPAAGYEIKAPAVQNVYLKAGEDKTVTFENIPKSALIIRKIDSDTGLPVQGAAFRVRYLGGTSGSGGTIIFEGVTSVNGTIVLTGMSAGTYVVEEYRAADGYELSNPSVQTAYLSGLDQDVVELEFTNAKKGEVIIQKLDAVTKQPLKGATFKVTDSSGAVIGTNNGIYTTDASGVINLGEYISVGSTIVVQETVAPEGYILDTTAQTLKIKENSTHMLTFYNSPKSGLQIVKIDSVTKQPIKGAEFTVYRKSGDVIGTYTTDGDGLIIIPELDSGWYKIVETKAPAGYILDDTPKDVEVTTNQFIKVVFENVPVPGLQILKLDEETRKPIANVEFRVAKMNGEIIGTYATDSQGIIRLPELESGWYTATETKSAKGYLLDDTVHTIEVKDGKTEVLTVTNRKTSGIIIHKIDSVTGEGIYGVTFLLYDENNNPIGQYESDQAGYVYIGEGLEDGKYKIRELQPAPGYVEDTQVKTVYLEYGRTTEIEWKNTPEVGQIIVTKRSAAWNDTTNLPAGSPLSGSVFEVYSLTGNLVDRMVSDSKGIAASKLLPLGVYVVKEVTPSKYYALNTREFIAELRHNGDIVRFEVLNENVDLGVTIQKKSQNQINPGQMILWDLYDVASTSSAALESFYVHDRLPTDAVRGSKVFTGTWSHVLSYRVTYKTNYSSEYRVLASGLSAKTDYELSIHPNVLGLASGEHVTDIRWEFGTVPAGFKSVTNPKIQAQVLPTLPKGYKIINRADVGGLYIGQWVTAQTSWTTLTHSGYTAPELPKTGF